MFTLHLSTGAIVPLRDTIGLSGNHYLASRPAGVNKVTRYGFNTKMAFFGGRLPEGEATLYEDETPVATVVLARDVTGSGNLKVAGQSTGFLYAGDEQFLDVRISQPHDGVANSLIRSHRARGGQLHDLS